jgi:hypothetical protein
MRKAKLYGKLYDRLGMTVFEKDYFRKGTIGSFMILDNPDGTYSVNYIVAFEHGETIRLETIHESKLILMIGTEI